MSLITFKSTLREAGNINILKVPSVYIRDGHFKLNTIYRVTLEEVVVDEVVDEPDKD